MNLESQNTKLAEGIYWVGYVDWNIRDFHSYMTRRGSTYNAYLIKDNKNVLIDTVKSIFSDYLINQLNQKMEGKKLDYIVMNHAEPDHAGSISEIMRLHPKATIVCTAKSQNIISNYHNTKGWAFKLVKDGNELNIGNRTLQFVETPMVHWPDSMFTYLPKDGILFSMDAFGQHYASSHHFDDQVDLSIAMQEAKKYYANIVMLYGPQIKKTMERAKNLDIKMIAPAHGIIWRSNLSDILEKYYQWVKFKAKPKVLVIYDSMWESTKKMAEAIIKGASVKGVDAKLLFVRAVGLTQIATEVQDAATIAFGSATLNRGMMPMMGATLTYLKGLRPKGKGVMVFGSTGWGKGATEDIMNFLQKMDLDIILDPIKTFWRPDQEILNECERAGRLLAEKAIEISNN